VLCVRDTPFNRVHLEKTCCVRSGRAVIMPAVPAFYHHPKTIDDLVMQYVCRVLAQIDLPQEKNVPLGQALRRRRKPRHEREMRAESRPLLEMIKFEHSVFACRLRSQGRCSPPALPDMGGPLCGKSCGS